MEVCEVVLEGSKITVPIFIERKKMKYCRLRVYPDKTVKLSVDERTSQQWIQQFLNSKRKWLSKKIEFFEQAKEYQSLEEIRSDDSFYFLGEKIFLTVTGSSKPFVYQEGSKLQICALDIQNKDRLFSQFDQWWRKESLLVLEAEVEKLYPIVGQYKITKPNIKLRKMKTLWGSCSPNRGVITFNQYLTKAPLTCVEYVVLHELVHFLYPNHSQDFYKFLSGYMPDWKERKRGLGKFIL